MRLLGRLTRRDGRLVRKAKDRFSHCRDARRNAGARRDGRCCAGLGADRARPGRRRRRRRRSQFPPRVRRPSAAGCRAAATAMPSSIRTVGRSCSMIPAFGRRRVTVNHDESPLAWLRRRKDANGRPMIDAAEFAAGERLRADYERAQLMPRVTANWMAAVAGKRRSGENGIADLTESALAARRRVEAALAVAGAGNGQPCRGLLLLPERPGEDRDASGNGRRARPRWFSG